jgi:hypothetical protein
MSGDRIEQALTRLDRALARAEAAAARQVEAAREAEELAGLQERHIELKRSVAQSLRQLDEILAGSPQ